MSEILLEGEFSLTVGSFAGPDGPMIQITTTGADGFSQLDVDQVGDLVTTLRGWHEMQLEKRRDRSLLSLVTIDSDSPDPDTMFTTRGIDCCPHCGEDGIVQFVAPDPEPGEKYHTIYWTQIHDNKGRPRFSLSGSVVICFDCRRQVQVVDHSDPDPHVLTKELRRVIGDDDDEKTS